MISRANPEALVSRLDVLIKIGLGSYGKVGGPGLVYWFINGGREG